MTLVFRPSTPADALQLKQLAAIAFDNERPLPVFEPAMMHWKFWAPRPDYHQPRSYVIEARGRIVAHSGFWPVRVDGLDGGHLIDWMAVPDEPGVGSLVHQRLGELLEFQFSIGGAQKGFNMLGVLGFTEMGMADSWARPLRPLRQMLTHQRRNWRLPGRYLRNLWWSRFPRASAATGCRAERIDRCQVPERQPGFFDYLAACPGLQLLCFRILEGSSVLGQFALARVGLQARVAGIWLEQPSVTGWAIALELAQRAALACTPACELLFRAASPASREAAQLTGMHWAGEEMICTRARAGGPVVTSLHYQLCDNDGVFLTNDTAENYAT